MKTPDEILTQISRINDNLQLAFGTPSQIKEEYSSLQNIHNDLLNIHGEIADFSKTIKEKIDEINLKNATKAVVGIALVLMGSDGDDDSSWIGDLVDSMLSDFGENLLDESMRNYIKYNVRDEAGIKSLYNNLLSLQEIIEVKIYQVNTLKTIAQFCFNNQEISRHLETDKYSFTFAKIEELFNQYLTKIKVNFSFNNLEYFTKQVDSWKQNFQHLNKIQKKVNQFYQFINQESNHQASVSSQLLLTILSFFGESITYLKYNQQGDLVWIISAYPYTLNDLLKESMQLNDYCNEKANFVLKLHTLIKNCSHNQGIVKLLNQPPESNNLQLLEKDIQTKFNKVKPILNIENFEHLSTQLQEITRVCQEVKSLNMSLKMLTNKYSKNIDFPLDSNSINALLSLFGMSVESIGFNEKGVFILTIDGINQGMTDYLEKCVNISEYLKNNLIQRVYLAKLADQIIKNSKLNNLIKETDQSLTVEQFFINIETEKKQFQVKFTFEKKIKLKQEVNNFQEVMDKINKKVKALKIITNSQDELTFNSSNLENYIFLFGLIQSFCFNLEGKLSFEQNKTIHRITDIQKKCNSLLPKLEKQQEKTQKTLTLAQNCLTDESLRQQTIQELKDKRKKVIILTTFASLLIISPLTWLGYNWGYSKFILWQSKQAITLETNIDQLKNIEQLKGIETQLNKAISSLFTIPNYPASAYQEAQGEIIKLKNQLTPLTTRIQTEEKASQNLATATQLATEAETIFKQANNQFTQLINAQEKLQQAINLLQSIPPSTFVSNEATEMLKNYQDQTNQITQTSKILQDFQEAEKLALEASQLVQNPPHPVETWQTAKTKWQTAIKLLSKVAQENIATLEIKEKLKSYQENYQIINNRLAQEKSALSNYNQAVSLAEKISKMVENPPHPLATWKQAVNQCNQTVTLLKSIASQTVIYPESQLKLIQYQANCTNLNNRLKSEENALNLITNAQRLEKEVFQSLKNNSYTISLLNQLLTKMKQAEQSLQKIPSGMAVSNKAQVLLSIYQDNMEEIADKIESLEDCQEYNWSYCFDAEYPIYWKSYNDN